MLLPILVWTIFVVNGYNFVYYREEDHYFYFGYQCTLSVHSIRGHLYFDRNIGFGRGSGKCGLSGCLV